MIYLILDVYYKEFESQTSATVLGVRFTGIEKIQVLSEHIAVVDHVAPYQSGQFYKWEMPFELMITPNADAFAEGQASVYGHSVWTDMSSPVPFYAMLGHLGQRVLVIPQENTIIVRLGKQKGLPTPVEGFNLEPDLGQYVTEVKVILDGLSVE